MTFQRNEASKAVKAVETMDGVNGAGRITGADDWAVAVDVDGKETADRVTDTLQDRGFDTEVSLKPGVAASGGTVRGFKARD